MSVKQAPCTSGELGAVQSTCHHVLNVKWVVGNARGPRRDVPGQGVVCVVQGAVVVPRAPWPHPFQVHRSTIRKPLSS